MGRASSIVGFRYGILSNKQIWKGASGRDIKAFERGVWQRFRHNQPSQNASILSSFLKTRRSASRIGREETRRGSSRFQRNGETAQTARRIELHSLSACVSATSISRSIWCFTAFFRNVSSRSIGLRCAPNFLFIIIEKKSLCGKIFRPGKLYCGRIFFSSRPVGSSRAFSPPAF